MQTNFIITAINSGRSTMKSETLNMVWGLLEEAAQNENEMMVKTLYWVHQKIKDMPSRIQDKPQEMLEEIEETDDENLQLD